MKTDKTLVKSSIYRIDTSGIPAFCEVGTEHRVLLADVALGTEFLTKGSTETLRMQFDIRHAAHLTLCFGERGDAYFYRENGEHVELVHCADLKLALADVPSAGH